MVRRIGLAVRARPVRRVQAGGFTITEGVHRHGSELPWHHQTPLQFRRAVRSTSTAISVQADCERPKPVLGAVLSR